MLNMEQKQEQEYKRATAQRRNGANANANANTNVNVNANANANAPSADDLGEVAPQGNDWAFVAFQDTHNAPSMRFERCRNAH